MAQPGSEEPFLWIGAAGMFLGMLAFIAMGWGEENERRKEYFIITIFIPAIAFVSYLSMALGFGLTKLNIGGMTLDIYWARYADWLFTTPLLLLDLALIANANRNTIATLIGLDVAMIVTGLIGAITGVGVGTEILGITAQRLIWWGISCGFLLVLLYFLFGTLTQQAERMSDESSKLFKRLRNIILVLWILYPVVWIIGTEGGLGDPGLVSLQIETAIFMVLDLSAKVGFGFILLRSRSVLGEDLETGSGAETGEASPA